MAVIESYLPKSAQTGKGLNRVRGIVNHWVANKLSTAKNNINYWKNQSTGVQAHEVIDLNGDLYLAVPHNVMCYQVGSKVYTKKALQKLSSYPNNCVVGLEWTHIDDKGTPTDATYETGVRRNAELCKEFNLTTDDIWLHWEVVGWKDCHRWFVADMAVRWYKFLKDVDVELARLKGTKPSTSVSRPPVQNNDIHLVENLERGDSGSAVTELQKQLKKLGFEVVGTADGEFGKNTEKAVMDFQKKNGLTADGVVGMNTRRELEEAIDELEGKKVWYRVRRDPKDSKTQLVALRDKEDALAYAKKNKAYLLEDDKVIYTPLVLVPKEPAKPVVTKPAPAKKVTYKLPNKVVTKATKNTKAEVKEIQKALNKLGFKCGAEDGIYGSAVSDAVMRFQSMFGSLKDDGKYGPATRKVMLEELAELAA